jgi:hypothetical protein
VSEVWRLRLSWLNRGLAMKATNWLSTSEIPTLSPRVRKDGPTLPSCGFCSIIIEKYFAYDDQKKGFTATPRRSSLSPPSRLDIHTPAKARHYLFVREISEQPFLNGRVRQV